MSKLFLDRGVFADYTSVSNLFIDEYMPKASGEFVKIYLYLLRLASSNHSEISTDDIADVLNFTESDVIRGLNYWDGLGLVSLSRDASNAISGIRLESFNSNKFIVKTLVKSTEPIVHAKAVGDDIYREDNSQEITSEPAIIESMTPAFSIPVKHKYTTKEMAVFNKDERVSQLVFLATTYLGKTLNSGDLNSILYMLNELKLSFDAIEYLLETCVESGSKSLSSIEKVAVNYYKRGIVTVEDLKFDRKVRKSIYKSVFKIFNLADKTTAKNDISYITRWSEEYGFSEDIIVEACNRTIAYTHTPSFPYADSILKGWYSKGIKDLENINSLDKVHNEETIKKFAVSHPGKKLGKGKSCSASLKSFKNMEERTYDSVELEKMLLSSGKNTGNKLD